MVNSNGDENTLFGQKFVHDIISRSAENPTDRRRFLRSAGLAGLGVLGAGVLSSAGGGVASAAVSAAAPPSDSAILNFALNLEYLEAQFYAYAVTGNGISDSLTTGSGQRGQVLGGKQVPFKTKTIRQAAQEIAADERSHVEALRAALGSAKVSQPEIDLKQSFTAAAQAAGLIKTGQSFDPYANENNFLLAAFIFEDVGVTAYKGAAPLIASKTYLDAAAGILAVEAYHAGQIRTRVVDLGLADMANKISAARDSLDGSTDDDQGVIVNGTVNIVPTNSSAMAFGRTPGQVLNVVYLTPKTATAGGFFPNGVNGTLNSSGGPQMGPVPAGPAGAGGGSTAGVEDKGLLTAGGAALLAAGGAAAYAAHQHTVANQDQEQNQES